MGTKISRTMASSSWGDVRSTEADYNNQNNNMLRLTVGSDRVDNSPEALDREYSNAMQRIGLDGVITMETMAKEKIEQRSRNLGLASFRRAFEPYDHEHSGQVGPEVFKRALEVFGLQFTEDQVMALFGFYDRERRGVVDYFNWAALVGNGKRPTR